MSPDAVMLQNFANLIIGFGYALVLITFALYIACCGLKKGHVAVKGRIEGAKLVEDAKFCEVISSGYRPPDPKPLGKSVITEGKMIKGGINRKEMTERPKTSPPSLRLRKM